MNDVPSGTASAVLERPSDSVAQAGAAAAGGAVDSVEVPELHFVRPLPGFPDLTRFALVRLEGSEDAEASEGASAGDVDGGSDGGSDSGSDGEDVLPPVLFELRSVEVPHVRFLVGVPTAFFPDYTFELDENAVADLGLTDADDALVLVVLTVGADAASTTANLLAPVVVNGRTRSAAQVILSGTDWPVRAAVV